MRAIIFLTLISMSWLSSVTDCQGQKEDYIWLFGYTSEKIYLPNGERDTTWGASDIDFNFDPPRIRFNYDRLTSIRMTNTSVCNNDGDLMFYSNGMSIYNGLDYSALEDTIAYSLYWNTQIHYNQQNKLVTGGATFVDYALILPEPDHHNTYWLLYQDVVFPTPSFSDQTTAHIFLAKMQFDSNSLSAHVLFKDSVLIQDTLSTGGLAACRHANGRDWWVVFPSRKHDELFIYLIDDKGIRFVRKQCFNEDWPYSSGQVKFSPDGTKLCFNRASRKSDIGSKVIIYDFDRCSGFLSNNVTEYIPLGYGWAKGVAYSPDSRYLYVSNCQWIYQYDLTEEDILASRKTVATYDGYAYFYPGTIDTTLKYPTNLGWMGNGPDGRIYISAGGANRKMGVMHYPNETGEACDVRQHSIHIPASYVTSMPTFPNYRLGPIDGSECDTLGLDNNPIAKFRYEQDTMDYLKVRFTDLSYFRPESWHWDFGDGTTITGTTAIERYPYHTFPHNGTYEVCLTVSNENSSNTACRTLTFGTASITTTEVKEIDVNLYPNPVKDQLNLTIYDYLPQKGMIQMFDARGNKMLSTRVYHGWNNVDMTRLLPGVYVYNIVDKGVVLKSGKVVKGE